MNPVPLRVLFLCTANSARSQIAQALLSLKGGGRFEAHSAGSHPASQVNPLAVSALKTVGIDWRGRIPRGIEGLEREHWDLVITVCDNARESCPIFPGQPVMAHWGMEDPAAATGSEAERLRAFDLALQLLARRIDLLVQLPTEKLANLALEAQVKGIAAQQ